MQTAKQVLSESMSFTLKEKDLDHLKRTELMMMTDLKAACEEGKIPYSLAFGTLLGAIRHKGFIPWDDDVDIWIPRIYFDRLITTVSKMYPEKYFFSGMGYDSWGDPFLGLKMMLKGTKAVEANAEAYPITRGIFIDIFPAFFVSGGKMQRKLAARKLCAWYHMNVLSTEYKYPPLTLLKNEDKKVSNYYKLRRIIGFVSRFGLKRRAVRINELTNRTSSKNSGDLFYFTTNNGGNFIKISFEALIEVLFENQKFKIVNNFDLLLKTAYGDYMKLPPEDKREKHAMAVLDFGIY